jgi:hypothetical protein
MRRRRADSGPRQLLHSRGRRRRPRRRRERRQPHRRHNSRPDNTHPRLNNLRAILRLDHRLRMRRRSDHRPNRGSPRRHLHDRRRRRVLHRRLIPTDLSHLRLTRSSIRRHRTGHNPGADNNPSQHSNCDERDTKRNRRKRERPTHAAEASDQPGPNKTNPPEQPQASLDRVVKESSPTATELTIR